MRRNSHVRFLGGWVAATPPTYPPKTRGWGTQVQKVQKGRAEGF